MPKVARGAGGKACKNVLGKATGCCIIPTPCFLCTTGTTPANGWTAALDSMSLSASDVAAGEGALGADLVNQWFAAFDWSEVHANQQTGLTPCVQFCLNYGGTGTSEFDPSGQTYYFFRTVIIGVGWFVRIFGDIAVCVEVEGENLFMGFIGVEGWFFTVDGIDEDGGGAPIEIDCSEADPGLFPISYSATHHNGFVDETVSGSVTAIEQSEGISEDCISVAPGCVPDVPVDDPCASGCASRLCVEILLQKDALVRILCVELTTLGSLGWSGYSSFQPGFLRMSIGCFKPNEETDSTWILNWEQVAFGNDNIVKTGTLERASDTCPDETGWSVLDTETTWDSVDVLRIEARPMDGCDFVNARCHCFLIGTHEISVTAEHDGLLRVYVNDEYSSVGDNSGSYTGEYRVNGGGWTAYEVFGNPAYLDLVSVTEGDAIDFRSGAGSVNTGDFSDPQDPDGEPAADAVNRFCPKLVSYALTGIIIPDVPP